MAWIEIEQRYIEEEGHLKWIHWTCSGYSHLINCKAQIKTETCNSKIETGVGIRTLNNRGDKSYNYNNTFPYTAFHIKLKLVLTSSSLRKCFLAESPSCSQKGMFISFLTLQCAQAGTDNSYFSPYNLPFCET